MHGSTDFLRRMIVPVEGQGGVTLSYECPHCHRSVSTLAQVGIQAPWLQFSLHLPSWQPYQDSSRVRFLFAVYIAWPLLPVAQSSSVVRLAAPVRVRSQWWNVGTKLGRGQPRAGLVGRLSRSPTSLCPTSRMPKGMEKRSTAIKVPLLQCLDVPAGFHGVIRRVNRWYQAVRIQSWKFARSFTNPRSTGRSKQTTNCGKFSRPCPEEHRELIYGDSFQSKMQSMDDEKAALLDAKRQFLPLQCRIEKQKMYLERISEDIEKKQQTRLEILQKWITADQELESANSEQVQAKQDMAILVA